MPPHRITLKVGMVIMLLPNFDQQNGHCNGSRYIIEQILPHLLVAKPVIGVNAGRTLLIPRMTLITSDNIFPFTLRWKQFPVRPGFAMTGNKSQGQSLQCVGVFCTWDFFQPWTILCCCQQSWQIKPALHTCSRWRNKDKASFWAMSFLQKCWHSKHTLTTNHLTQFSGSSCFSPEKWTYRTKYEKITCLDYTDVSVNMCVCLCG